MQPEHAQAFQKHLKLYIGVFVALLIGTLLTVAASQVHLGTAGNVAVALIIASMKAALVAAFFMHLSSEKRTIYAIMAFAVIFFAVLMFLTLFSMTDVIALKHVS
jgi:cytochrome c oxidase subunit 4